MGMQLRGRSLPRALPPVARPMGAAGARDLAGAILRDAVQEEGRGKYATEFAKYRAFCDAERLDWRPMENETVLVYLDSRCKEQQNSVSAEQWRSQLWTEATREHGARPYSLAADGPFWKRAYIGLARRYGCDHAVPLGLTGEPMLQVVERLKPDYDRNPLEYMDFVHMLMSHSWMLRPNEHTGPRHSCYARNVRFLRTKVGTELVEITFEKGSTKGERRDGVVGYSKSARGQALRAATLAASGRYVTFARSKPGSPLCPVTVLRNVWRLRKLDRYPDRLLFPSVRYGFLSQAPMSGAEWNRRLRSLLARAGVKEKYSSRCARPGGRTELGDAANSVKDALGRWRAPRGSASSAGARYDRLDHRIADSLPPR